MSELTKEQAETGWTRLRFTNRQLAALKRGLDRFKEEGMDEISDELKSVLDKINTHVDLFPEVFTHLL